MTSKIETIADKFEKLLIELAKSNFEDSDENLKLIYDFQKLIESELSSLPSQKCSEYYKQIDNSFIHFFTVNNELFYKLPYIIRKDLDNIRSTTFYRSGVQYYKESGEYPDFNFGISYIIDFCKEYLQLDEKIKYLSELSTLYINYKKPQKTKTSWLDYVDGFNENPVNFRPYSFETELMDEQIKLYEERRINRLDKLKKGDKENYKYKFTKGENYSHEKLKIIFDGLKELEFPTIKCEFEKFKKVFEGDGQIVWYDYFPQLYDLLLGMIEKKFIVAPFIKGKDAIGKAIEAGQQFLDKNRNPYKNANRKISRHNQESNSESKVYKMELNDKKKAIEGILKKL